MNASDAVAATSVNASIGFTPNSRLPMSSERKGGDEAQYQTECSQPAAFQDHLPHDVSGRRPERHTDPKLLPPLGDGEGHHAINADRRQRECRLCRCAKKRKIQPGLCD
jgi:hypothetical protein